MFGYVTDEVVKEITHILKHPEERRKLVNNNYELASRFFSYEVLEQKLRTIISNIEGISNERRDPAKWQHLSLLSDD